MCLLGACPHMCSLHRLYTTVVHILASALNCRTPCCSVLCAVLYAPCFVRCALCWGVLCAVCCLSCALFWSVRCYCVLCAVYCVLCAVCCVLCAGCSVLCAGCSVLCAGCCCSLLWCAVLGCAGELSPVECIHWVSAPQLALLEDEIQLSDVCSVLCAVCVGVVGCAGVCFCSPVECIHWVSAPQLGLLEDEMQLCDV